MATPVRLTNKRRKVREAGQLVDNLLSTLDARAGVTPAAREALRTWLARGTTAIDGTLAELEAAADRLGLATDACPHCEATPRRSCAVCGGTGKVVLVR